MTDLRDAIRALRATPVVTAVAILSLGLGIGANTAIFSILDAVMLRTLPVKDPARLHDRECGQWRERQPLVHQPHLGADSRPSGAV